MTRSPETLAYLAHHLRTRAAVLLQRAQSTPLAPALALTATAYRALSRAAQLVAELLAAMGGTQGAISRTRGTSSTYHQLASAYAHAADLRGA